MKIIKNLSILNFLHCVLAVQKREISLPVGSQTTQSGDLGIVEPWSQNKNANFWHNFFADFDGSGQKIYWNILGVNSLT